MRSPRHIARFRPARLLAACLTATLLLNAAFAQQEEFGDDLFQFPPETPAKRVRGAIIANSLGRPDLAQGYLQELVRNQPGTTTLLELRTEFGIGTFLDLSANPSLAPASRQLLQLINEASLQEPASSSSVELLIEQLGQKSPAAKDAVLTILSAGAAAAAPLLNADPQTTQGAVAEQILTRHARRFRYGLLAELATADDLGKVRILNLLKDAQDEQIARDLLPLAFVDNTEIAAAAQRAVTKLSSRHPLQISSADDAVELLLDEAMMLIGQVDTRFPDDPAMRLDRQLGLHLGEDLRFGVASLSRAIQLVDLALMIAPDAEPCQAAQKVVTAAQAGFPSRWTNVDPEMLKAAVAGAQADSTDVMALTLAIESGSPAAILQLLKDTPTALGVLRDNPHLYRPLLLSGDSRVRLLGSGLINILGVRDHRIDQLITVFGQGSLDSEAVVIDSRKGEGLGSSAVAATSRLETAGNIIRQRTGAPPTDDGLSGLLGMTVEQLQQARDMPGPLTQSYDATNTGSGQAGFVAASTQMCCELVLIHSNCLRWDTATTIANLRTDFRTREIPIVIYGPDRDEKRTAVVRQRFPGVWFVPEPLSELTFHEQLKMHDVPGPLLSVEERVSMRKFARTLIPQ